MQVSDPGFDSIVSSFRGDTNLIGHTEFLSANRAGIEAKAE
jgi:hypothetical protein